MREMLWVEKEQLFRALEALELLNSEKDDA